MPCTTPLSPFPTRADLRLNYWYQAFKRTIVIEYSITFLVTALVVQLFDNAMSHSASASANVANQPSDNKSDGEIPEQMGDSAYETLNLNNEDDVSTTASVALLQSRLESAGSTSLDDDVTMVHTRSQATNTPRASPPPSPR